MANISNPISNASSSFKTRKVSFESGKLKIRPTLPGLVIGVILFLFLNGTFFYLTYAGIRILLHTEHLLLGILFTATGIMLCWLFFRLLNPLSERAIDFDKSSGEYSVFNYWRPNKIYKTGCLSDISSIQVLYKTVKTHNGTRSVKFKSIEVNLYISGSPGLNLLDHGNKNAISSDVNSISKFLDIKIINNKA